MRKLLVIGLDGATLDLIEPWANSGKLPVMAQLMKNGTYGRLQSVLPVLSSAAWSSFMTGMNPGKHGFYDFVKRAPDSYRLRPVSREQMGGRSLWRILSELDKKVIVMNVPMTYPPETVNGLLVTGLGTPSYKNFTYPSELTAELQAKGYKVNSEIAFTPGREKDFIDEVYEITDQLTETLTSFMNRQDWDFAMVVYRDPDEMAHFFWRYMDETHPQHPTTGPEMQFKDAILEYYQKVDQAIGTLLKEVGEETNVLIMSDHGTGPFYKDVLLNEWLRQKGWLVTKKEKDASGLANNVFKTLGITRSNISTTLRSLKMGKVERWLKDVLGNRIEILPASSHANFPDEIDWERTKAYSFGYHGQIYINLKGREPQGIVSAGEEYDQLCQEISQSLMTIVDPQDGKPVVDQVVHRSQAFHGPAFDDAPDMVVIMRALSYITRSGYEFGSQPGEIFSPPHQYQSGSHRMDGVFIMAGPDILPAGYKGRDVVITDLAPTALHMMECPVPDDMDGRALTECLSDQREVQLVQSDTLTLILPKENEMTVEQEQELMQRLRDLGYLE